MADGRQGWLLDTPGFDDTSRSDTEILREIASTLTELYKRDHSLAGILYLHRITDPKMGHSAIRNLEIFKRLCGREAWRGVTFVTTRWDGIEEGTPTWESAIERERQLATTEKYWASLIREGANVQRHFGTRGSALSIIDTLLHRRFNISLAIQEDMGKHELSLDQTAAGQFLAKEQEDLQARYEQEMKDLEEEKQEAISQKDRELAQELTSQEEKYRSDHAQFSTARHDLHVDFRQLSRENAQLLASLTSQQSTQTPGQQQRGGDSTDQITAKMDLITQNIAEMQEDMERRDREHEEQISRLRKQARNRDKEHEVETARLIEQITASHANEKRRMRGRMETLRKNPRGGHGYMGGSGSGGGGGRERERYERERERDRYERERERERYREREEDEVDHGWIKVLKWMSGYDSWTMNSIPR